MNNKTGSLSAGEIALLHYFMSHEDRVVTSDELVATGRWKKSSVWSAVCNIRKKNGLKIGRLVTVRTRPNGWMYTRKS